jgi:hypothetical protein
LEKEVKALIGRLADENGVVRVDLLAGEVRGLTHPLVAGAAPHESIYRMKEVRKIPLGEYDADKDAWK